MFSQHVSRSHYLPMLICVLYAWACADLESANQDDQSQDKANESSVQTQSLFSYSTPLGDQLLELSRTWEVSQVDYKDEYAQPRMCAHNVSKVLDDAKLFAYGDYLVPYMLNKISVRGGIVTQLPREKQYLIQYLNQEFNGRLPMGTLVNGCLNSDCSGGGGDGHIAILGHTDEDGVVYLYHNNWYRPDNEGGVWKEWMVSKEYYYDLDLRRQWMATPWMKITRDPKTDLIIDIEGSLPAIDDLDPFYGYFITISIMPELLAEMNGLDHSDIFCPDGTFADLMLGACVDGIESDANVFGLFPNKMVEDCEAYGLGQACTREIPVKSGDHTVYMKRWSRGIFESLRGDFACAKGLKMDHDKGRCIQESTLKVESNEENQAEVPAMTPETEIEVFGPFSKHLVDLCLAEGIGEECVSGRWTEATFNRVSEGSQWQ